MADPLAGRCVAAVMESPEVKEALAALAIVYVYRNTKKEAPCPAQPTPSNSKL